MFTLPRQLDWMLLFLSGGLPLFMKQNSKGNCRLPCLFLTVKSAALWVPPDSNELECERQKMHKLGK
jgi:hypothetical protein